MKGISFGDHHSSDYGLILSSKEITSPEPKLETVDLPGADGLLDMTDYFGDVKYKNRKLKFTLSTSIRGMELLEIYSIVQNDLSGRHFDSIILDDDPNYRYTGRVTTIALSEGKISKLVIECDCGPYRTSIDDKTITVTLNSLPFANNYGDPNGDGVVNNLDSVYMMKLVKDANDGIDITRHLASCDLNFDGVINSDDVLFMDNYLSQSTYNNIRSYAESKNIMRETEIEIDFGRKATEVKVNWAFKNGGTSIRWQMYVDGVLYMDKYATEGNITTVITGKHRVTFRTWRLGTVTIKFPESKL